MFHRKTLFPSAAGASSSGIFPITVAWTIFVSLFASPVSRAGNSWTGLGGSSDWNDTGNWGGVLPVYGTLTFSGSNQTTNTNNSITAQNMLLFTGSNAWTLNNSGGTVLSLYDNGGAQAKIENQSSGLVTLNLPITFAATTGANFGEINAVTGNLHFGSGTLTVNGSAVNGIKFWGGAGKSVIFNNTVSASGKWLGITSTAGTSIVIGPSANVTSGDIYVMNNGTLNLAGGTLTTTAVRLGSDGGTTGNQDLTLGATLALTPAAGGISFSSPIHVMNYNTSNALLIDSRNTSGTNTISSGIFLDNDLKIQQANGGSLSFAGGAFQVLNRKLTVTGAGTTTISEVLSSSLSTGGYLVKEGGGTLILSNTSNTYTGTSANQLNANGTQINGGTLGIHGDGSLGLAPAGVYNNIQFTGNGTLQDTANNISLSSTRNISIAGGVTATFDNGGNTFTIGGEINGAAGNVETKGSGTVVFAENNTYGGTTTISAGTLQIGNGGGFGSLGAGTVNNNGALVFNRATYYNVTNSITGSGSVTQDNGSSITLSNNNSYAGPTLVNQGLLEVTTNNALGSTTSGTTVANGATLQLTSVNYTANEALVLNGIGTGGIGALHLSGPSAYAGQITIATNATINTTGGILDLTGGIVKNGTTLTFNGTGQVNILSNGISGASPNSDLVIDGTTVVLGAASSYNGPTTIQSGGTLRLGGDNMLPSSPHTAITLGSNGTFDLASHNDSVASLSAAFSLNAKIINSVSATTSTLTIGADNGSGYFEGLIDITGGGDIAIVKTGTGIQTFGIIPHFYGGGTTVSAGTLNIIQPTSDPNLGFGNINVASGATLSGTGTVDTDNGQMIINGTLSPGDATQGAHTVGLFRIDTNGAGSTVFGAGSHLIMDLSSGAGFGGGVSDQVQLLGTLDLSNLATLVLGNPNLMTTWAAGDTWQLFTFPVNNPGIILNDFLTIDATALALPNSLYADFDPITGYLTLVAIPEPSGAILLAGSLLVTALRRRRA